MPEYRRIQEFLEKFLGADSNEFDRLAFDLTQVRALQPNEALRSERLTNEFKSGILTLNEVREQLGYDPADGGDLRRVPMNIVELAPGESIDSALPGGRGSVAACGVTLASVLGPRIHSQRRPP